MRNLALHTTKSASVPNAHLCATALDLDNNVLYAASARLNADADAEVEIWKLDADESDPTLLTMYTSSSYTPSVPFPVSQVASFKLLPETRSLVCVTRGGDITTLAVEEDAFEVETVGSVDSGILAAEWSPDDTLLVLVTGDAKLMVMTPTFDVLSEFPLDTADFGADAPINVGWGSKQTQFHGSLGKAAAQAPSAAPADAVGASPDDDALPRVSWRGDGAFFVVSSLAQARGNARARRLLRVYDRLATLQSTSEPVPGLEHGLAWRPSGNLIAGTQRFGFEGGGAGKEGRHDIVFFERNGLRHGEFGVRIAGKGAGAESGKERKWEYRVRELSWSADSSVLAVWVEGDEEDIVQLWTTGNYHWYLKHEILASASGKDKDCRFTSMTWHPEASLELILTTSSNVIRRTYAMETWVSLSQIPVDSGTVAVLDGDKVLLTPFRTQNVPPPMSSYQLNLSETVSGHTIISNEVPIHAAFALTKDAMVVLYESGRMTLWDLQTRLGTGKGKVMDPRLLWDGQVAEEAVAWRQATLSVVQEAETNEGLICTVIVLGRGEQGRDAVAELHVRQGSVYNRKSLVAFDSNGRLVPSLARGEFFCQSAGGEVRRIDHEGSKQEAEDRSAWRFSEFCAQAYMVPSEADPTSHLCIGLSSRGKLQVASTSSTRSLVLATNANSFIVGAGFIIYTTTAHLAHFVPIAALPALLAGMGTEGAGAEAALPAWETRRVERGSRIVAAVPSAMSLVLQMPRGNLETVCPRPLVMAVVRRDIDAGEWRKAFLACRKHRIDLTVLVEHDRVAFLRGLPAFVEQVEDVDYLNLFLTSVGASSQPDEDVAELCDAMRKELERRDLRRYINSVLTALVVKRPPDHEAGLALLLHLRESEPALVEDAVKYIIFLVDADRLFDTALGMYDFSLVLLVAQHAQKDPREYLPFLRDLRALDKFYQRFRIDDHLRRHASALRNLSLAGEERFDEAMAYVEKHRLHEEALEIWAGDARYNEVLNVYGDYLFERREFAQAALVFVSASRPPKALVAYERALDWHALFALAACEGVSGAEINEMGYRVAEDLGGKKRHAEAGRVLLDYCGDVRGAVGALVEGNEFAEARRVIAKHTPKEEQGTENREEDLLIELVHPGALNAAAQIGEDVGEMRGQLQKQRARVAELRIRKLEDPEAFFGGDDAALQNVDVMTDASGITAFTRYTVAPSAASSSKKTARSKRKRDRQAASGRKGTVDEEEYLLKSVTKLVARFEATCGEADALLPHLLQFTPAHRDAARVLRGDVASFGEELRAAVDEMWSGEMSTSTAAEVWVGGLAGTPPRTNAVERVLRPSLALGGAGGLGTSVGLLLRGAGAASVGEAIGVYRILEQ